MQPVFAGQHGYSWHFLSTHPSLTPITRSLSLFHHFSLIHSALHPHEPCNLQNKPTKKNHTPHTHTCLFSNLFICSGLVFVTKLSPTHSTFVHGRSHLCSHVVLRSLPPLLAHDGSRSHPLPPCASQPLFPAIYFPSLPLHGRLSLWRIAVRLSH